MLSFSLISVFLLSFFVVFLVWFGLVWLDFFGGAGVALIQLHGFQLLHCKENHKDITSQLWESAECRVLLSNSAVYKRFVSQRSWVCLLISFQAVTTWKKGRWPKNRTCSFLLCEWGVGNPLCPILTNVSPQSCWCVMTTLYYTDSY